MRPNPQMKKYLDSDEDEDDLIQSSAKHFLKTPGSRSSRRQSFDDDNHMEDDDSPYEAPKPSKNFFSTFKKIQGIFSLDKKVPLDGNEEDESMR